MTCKVSQLQRRYVALLDFVDSPVYTKPIEGTFMTIRIKARAGESAEQMLRRFKKLCEKEGLTKDIKRQAYYEKPSERRRRSMRKSIKRTVGGPLTPLKPGMKGAKPGPGGPGGGRGGERGGDRGGSGGGFGGGRGGGGRGGAR